jgi:threonine/homoserine/homoserine lactone efflux protein
LVLQDPILQLVTGVFGIALLLYLGITTIRLGSRLAVVPSGHAPGTSTQRAFFTGAGLSLANPMDIVFWLSIGNRISSDPEFGGLAFFSGFFTGCLLSSLGVALFGSLWSSRLTPKTVQAISWICGVTLIGFGLRLGLSIAGQLSI